MSSGYIPANQIAVGNSTNGIAGSSNFTFDGTRFKAVAGLYWPNRLVSGAGNVLATDVVVFTNSGGGAFAMNMPLATAAPKQIFILSDLAGSATGSNVQFNLAGGDTIRGGGFFLLKTNFATICVTNDGVNLWQALWAYDGT